MWSSIRLCCSTSISQTLLFSLVQLHLVRESILGRTLNSYYLRMKNRKAITNTQRRALRKWFFDPSTKTSAKTHADASTWWEKKYGYYLNSSSVSEILSYKYDPLDDVSADPAYCQIDTRKRQRPPKWETLEEELIKWVFWHECVAGNGAVTGAMLKDRGTELWNTLECHRGMPMPKWSEGWQCRFRSRYAHRKEKMLDEMARSSSCGSSNSGSGEYDSSDPYETGQYSYDASQYQWEF